MLLRFNFLVGCNVFVAVRFSTSSDIEFGDFTSLSFRQGCYSVPTRKKKNIIWRHVLEWYIWYYYGLKINATYKVTIQGPAFRHSCLMSSSDVITSRYFPCKLRGCFISYVLRYRICKKSNWTATYVMKSSHVLTVEVVKICWHPFCAFVFYIWYWTEWSCRETILVTQSAKIVCLK